MEIILKISVICFIISLLSFFISLIVVIWTEMENYVAIKTMLTSLILLFFFAITVSILGDL
jgi:hypothetical protein